ncbi:MAG: hypothetical protein SGI73_20525 [Chloroflexota bacterium]|nr:hypothetical protein [Chloroflexota bacterium]
MSVTLSSSPPFDLPYARIIVLQYDGTHMEVLDTLAPYIDAPTYQPAARYSPDAPLPERYFTLLRGDA